MKDTLKKRGLHVALADKTIRKKVWKNGIPMILANLCYGFMPLADRFLSTFYKVENGTEILTVCAPLTFFIRGIAMWTGIGASINYTIAVGQKNSEKALGLKKAGLYTSAFLSIICVLLVWWGAPFIAEILGAEKNVSEKSTDFMRIIIFTFPAETVSFCFARYLIADNRMWAGFAIPFAGVICRLLSGFALIPVCDFRGNGYCVLIGSAASLGAAIILCRKEIGGLCCIKRGSHVIGCVGQILFAGASQLFQQLAAMVTFIFLNLICADTTLRTSLGTAMLLSSFLTMPTCGINQGISPEVGRCVGAEEWGRIKKCFFATVAASFALTVILWIPLMLFAEKVGDLIGIQSVGKDFLRLFILLIPLFSFSGSVSNYMLALKKSLQASVLTVARQAVFLVPCILLLKGESTGYVGMLNDGLSFLLSLALFLPLWFEKIVRNS